MHIHSFDSEQDIQDFSTVVNEMRDFDFDEKISKLSAHNMPYILTQKEQEYFEKESAFSKITETDKIWRLDTDTIGPILFTFDKKKIYNFWPNCPDDMTQEEVEIFDKENPCLAKLHSKKQEND